MTVADDGPGIPFDELVRLFERFFRSRSSRAVPGSGLALSKAIADAHGGQLSDASTVGVGTSFSFLLPLDPPVDVGSFA